MALSLDQAIVIATQAHTGQVDKGGGPYILHPLRVMLNVDPDARAVAVLHDTIEDTALTLDELAMEGASTEELAALDALTHRPGEPNEDYWARVAANRMARHVKWADIADNSDEARLARLPGEDASRLRSKYARARSALTSGGRA